MRIPFQWNTANFAWESNPFPNQSITPFTWDDCALIVEIVTELLGGKSPSDIFKGKEKKKKFIKLICKVEGTEYKETKEVIDRQIRITDIALVAKEVLGIDLKVDL
jgi:hypothetical protein